DSLLIVDLASGDTIASLPCDLGHGATIGLSPDGQTIAVAAGTRMTAWSLKDGSLYRDETIPGMAAFTGTRLIFTSPTHVLVSGSTLVDLENHSPLWSFSGVEAAREAGGSTL